MTGNPFKQNPLIDSIIEDDLLDGMINQVSRLEPINKSALTIDSSVSLRPNLFRVGAHTWANVEPEILTKNIIIETKQEKQYKNDNKNYKNYKNNYIVGDFSPQGNDKKYKKIFENMSEVEMCKALEQLFLSPTKLPNKPSKKQLLNAQRKLAQQQSYHTADKARTKYWKKRFMECAKNIPPEEFVPQSGDYTPQMKIDVDVGNGLKGILEIMSTFFKSGPFKAKVTHDIDPFGKVFEHLSEFLMDETYFLILWTALGAATYTQKNWFTATIFLMISVFGYRYHSETIKNNFMTCFHTISGLLAFIVDRLDPKYDIRQADWYSERFEIGDTMEFHEQGSCDSLIDPISDGLFTMLFAKVFHTSFKHSNFSNLARDLGSFDRTQKGVNDFVGWFMQRLQKFLNWMTATMNTGAIDLVAITDSDVVAFSKDIADLISDFDDGTVVNFDFFVRVAKLKKQGEHLLADTIPSATHRRNALRLVINKLQPLLDKCRANNVINNGPRRTPLGIIIGGAPGVGKSYSSVPFLHELMARVIDEKSLENFLKNPNDYILNRVWENAYWDADHCQFCINYDDLGQTPNPLLTKENEYMEVIRGINSLNFPLTMAALTDKGSTNFHHQLVFATTNRTYFGNCQGVTSPEAVVRRFKIAYWLAPRKEYCIDPDVEIMHRRLDVSKCQGVFDENVHEFFRYDFLSGKFLDNGPGISYRQLLDLCVVAFKNNVTKEDAALNNMRDALERGRILREIDQFKPQGLGDAKAYLHKRWKHYCTELGAPEFLPQMADIVLSNTFVATDKYIDLCGFDLAQSELTDEQVLKINRQVLLLAIAKTHGFTREVAHDIAFSLTPDRDLHSWVTLNCNVINEAVVAYMRNTVNVSNVMAGESVYDKTIGNFVRKHPIITKLLAALTVLTPVIVGLNSLWSKLNPQSSRQDWIKQKTPVAQRYQYQNVRFIKQGGVEAQSHDIPSMSTGLSQFAHKVYRKNTYLIRLNHDREFCGSITFLKHNVAVMPMHFIDSMLRLADAGFYNDPDQPGNCIQLIKPNTDVCYCFKPNQLDICIVANDNDTTLEDVAFVRFKILHTHCDLVNYFIESNDHMFDHNFNIMLNIAKPSGPVALVSKGNLGHITYGDYVVDCCVEYRIRTSQGDCGAVCYSHNPKTSKPVILGVHVAGSSAGHGVSYFLSKSHIEKALERLDSMLTNYPTDIQEEYEAGDTVEPQMFVSDKLPEDDMPKIKSDNKVAVKKVDPPRSVTATQIIPSAVHGLWGKAITRPARLREFVKDGEVINPMKKAFADYGGGFPVFNQHLMDAVTNEYIHHLHSNADAPAPWEPRIWSFEEACEGVPGVEFCEGIPRQTSPGYPLCMYTKGPGKTDFFGKDGEYSFTSEACVELRRKVDSIINNARLGIRDKHYFMTFLKDERRKLKKYEDGDTRMISGTDLAFLIACRMYFGDFIRWMMSNRIRNGSAVGVNPFGEEWGVLYRHLVANGAECIDGDYQAYDKSERENMHSVSFTVAESYYSNSLEDDRNIRLVLSQEILNPQYLCDGVIWSAHGSMPSGSFFTTMFNTIANNVLLRYAIVGAAIGKDHRIANDMDFVHCVSLLGKEAKFIALGDDNIWSLTGSLRNLVVPGKVAQILNDLGFKYTAADKTPLDTSYRELKFCTFLKRGFYVSDKAVLAPLDIKTIREMPYWTKKNAPPDNEYEVLTQALYELSLHSPEYFDKFAPKFIEASIKYYGKPPPFTTHRSCRAKIRTMVAMF